MYNISLYYNMLCYIIIYYIILYYIIFITGNIPATTFLYFFIPAFPFLIHAWYWQSRCWLLFNDDDGDDSAPLFFHQMFAVAEFTEKEILANSLVFMLAGYDTTASLIMFACHSLAVNPTCQQRLLEEIETHLGQVRVTEICLLLWSMVWLGGLQFLPCERLISGCPAQFFCIPPELFFRETFVHHILCRTAVDVVVFVHFFTGGSGKWMSLTTRWREPLGSRGSMQLSSRGLMQLSSRGSMQLSSRGLLQLSSRGLLQLSSRGLMQLSSRGPMQLSSRGSMQLSSRGPMQLSSRGPMQLSSRGSMQLSSRGSMQLSCRGSMWVSSRAGWREGRRWGGGRGVEGEVVVVESGRSWEVHG